VLGDAARLAVHVAPSTGVMPSGAVAASTMQVKSASVGGGAPWQSWNVIVNRVPGRGVIAPGLLTSSRSA
jgi:hypothetical protein